MGDPLNAAFTFDLARQALVRPQPVQVSENLQESQNVAGAPNMLDLAQQALVRLETAQMAATLQQAQNLRAINANSGRFWENPAGTIADPQMSYQTSGQSGGMSNLPLTGESPLMWFDDPPDPVDLKAGEDGYTDEELKAMGDDRLSRVIKDLIRRLRDSKSSEVSLGDARSAETSAWLVEQLRRAERVYSETKAVGSPASGVVGYGPGPRVTTKIDFGTACSVSKALGVSTGYYDRCCYEDGNPTDITPGSPLLHTKTIGGKRYNFTQVVHICCYEMGRWCRYSVLRDEAANVYSGAHQSSGLCNQFHPVDKDCLA